MHLSIELIPGEIKHLAEHAASVTTTIRTDLQKGIVTDVAALFPGGGQLQTDCIAACNLAIQACTAVEGIAGSPAVQAIFQRLGADIVRLQHANNNHTISDYITWFEVIFHDIFGKQ